MVTLFLFLPRKANIVEVFLLDPCPPSDEWMDGWCETTFLWDPLGIFGAETVWKLHQQLMLS